MKRDSVNYLLVGGFVLAVFVAFLAFMYFVTGRNGPADHYVAYYSNVTGLKFGTGVFFEGYQVGQIDEIRPEPQSSGVRYRVNLSVEKGWRIPTDSVARVVSSGLISQVQIQIEQGRSARILRPGAEIHGVEQQDLFSALSAAASGFNDLSQTGVAPVLQNLNDRITQIAEEIVDFRRQDLSPLVKNLDRRYNQELAGQAAATLASLDTSARRLERILGPENERQIGQFLQHIDTAAVELNGLITRIEVTRREMDGVLHGLDGLVADNGGDVAAAVRSARAALERLEASLTVVNENIGAVMYHVQSSAQQTNELARSLRQNPSRLIRGDAAPTQEALPP